MVLSWGVSVVAARVLDGTAVAQAIRQELAADVAAFTARAGRPPGLALVLVGDDPASHLYVNSKLKVCGRIGVTGGYRAAPGDGEPFVATGVDRAAQRQRRP